MYNVFDFTRKKLIELNYVYEHLIFINGLKSTFIFRYSIILCYYPNVKNGIIKYDDVCIKIRNVSKPNLWGVYTFLYNIENFFSRFQRIYIYIPNA